MSPNPASHVGVPLCSLRAGGHGETGLPDGGGAGPAGGAASRVTEAAVPTVLALDVFDTLNFTGAWLPRFEDVREDVPRELVSSVFFPADFFTPPERRGEAPRGPRAALGGGGGSCRWVPTAEHVPWVHVAALLANGGRAGWGRLLESDQAAAAGPPDMVAGSSRDRRARARCERRSPHHAVKSCLRVGKILESPPHQQKPTRELQVFTPAWGHDTQRLERFELP